MKCINTSVSRLSPKEIREYSNMKKEEKLIISRQRHDHMYYPAGLNILKASSFPVYYKQYTIVQTKVNVSQCTIPICTIPS